jgi:hypothetical protein
MGDSDAETRPPPPVHYLELVHDFDAYFAAKIKFSVDPLQTEDSDVKMLTNIKKILKNKQNSIHYHLHEGNEEQKAKARLDVAFIILACLPNTNQPDMYEYAADICTFPRLKIHSIKDGPFGISLKKTHRIDKFAVNVWPEIFCVVVRDSRAYLDVMRAMDLLPFVDLADVPVDRTKTLKEWDETTLNYDRRYNALMETPYLGNNVISNRRWEWNYYAYEPQKYVSEKPGEANTTKNEISACEYLVTPPNDQLFAVMGHNFVLQRRLALITLPRFVSEFNKILTTMQTDDSIHWLYTSPKYPYLVRMQASHKAGSDGIPDLFRVYEYMFYLSLENCSLNDPATGSIITRDKVSMRPLTFEVKKHTKFAGIILAVFKPPQAEPAKNTILYKIMERMCISPIVVTQNTPEILAIVKQSEETGDREGLLNKLSKAHMDNADPDKRKVDVMGYSLSELLTLSVYKHKGHVASDTGVGFSGKTGGLRLMHFSLYSPNYKQNEPTVPSD